MREWIPSETVRKYMEKNGKLLSDFDKAAFEYSAVAEPPNLLE